jgi:hypothetical protein
MLVWPMVAVLGFVVLAALVIALGTSSTARYEFERNRVQGQRQQAAVPTAVGAAAVADGSEGRPGGDQSLPAAGTGNESLPAVGTGSAASQEARPAAAVGLATHPAGKRVPGQGTPAWWLVDDAADQSGEQVVAGPFPDRIEAEWAALSGGLATSGRAVHGVLRADGRLVRRQSPEERAWLSDLGDQLDRLPDDWDGPMSDEDELVTLVVELASALVEAGLPLHDCAGQGPAGGVCLTPEPGRPGVLVSWHQHDRMSHEQVRGAAVHAAVQQTMNSAIAECLRQLGFDVEPYGATGCSLVSVGQRWS